MSGMQKPSGTAGACPFCGVATPVPHETQAGCIAALQIEINRMRGILATLKSTAITRREDPDNSVAAAARLTLD